MKFRCSLASLLSLSMLPAWAFAIDTADTRFLSQPAVSKERIAFVYAEDLWTCDLNGGNVQRLTTDDGVEANPSFSPDGSWIAFSAQYDGNTDVFLIPAEGGIPRRLTWHPGPDTTQGFTPDGSAVLFTSPREVFTGRHTQLFEVSVDGGMPRKLEVPNAFKAVYSPAGDRLAYVPLYEAFRQWKNYRGGTASRIWLYNFRDHSVEEIPQPAGRCNDTDPMWIGNRVYFISDRDGEFGIFAYDTNRRDVRPVAPNEDFPVDSASAGGGRIVYERAGQIALFEPESGRSRRVRIGAAADLIERRPRWVKGERYIRSADISPSGARAVFEFRGEVITVPEKKGDPRNLTVSVAAHDRSPVWSPDGSRVAYFSDEGGEYALKVRTADGKEEARSYPLQGAGFYENPVWSPDSRRISFFDNSLTLLWIDLESGEVKTVAQEPYYGPIRPNFSTWSPDSKWIIYTLGSRSYVQTVFAYSVEQEESFTVTDGLSEASQPVFDRSGKYLYFFASTDAGPAKHWFAMSNADARQTRSIYLAVLKKGTPSPLARESDEEPAESGEGRKAGEKTREGNRDGEEGKKEDGVAVQIDFQGLNERILTLPVPEGNYSNLRAGDEGQIFFLSAPFEVSEDPDSAARKTTLQKYDLGQKKEETLLTGIAGFEISADRKKVLYHTGSAWCIASLSGKLNPSEDKIDTDAIQVKIDPPAEWEQIFQEAWRINRDYFYDPGMHGADWSAIRDKYAVFLPHLAVRSDLNRLIRWMCSELSVGHSYLGGGDRMERPETVPGGLLGADYQVSNGRYQFKKVYGGLNWNPELRSPLTEPGVDVAAGEYLLAVNGQDLRPPTNLYSLFEATSEKIVEITVGPEPDGSGSRTVKVVPLANEGGLRNRDWVEGNLRRVEEATGGRVAYVYVPNTTRLGHTYFKRYFYPQAHKQAIIIDERFNGGGQVADYYIDLLRRPLVSHWATRYGEDIKTPSASIQGPKVMIIDETAGSGGDLLPWMFRKFQLGPLVGKTTWGGLVGILGFPVLLDGGVVTAPNLAIWTEDGFVVENVGVPPDVEVEQLPAEVIQGRDPQLEKAIELVLEGLERNPPVVPARPPYPVRVRK